MRLTVATRTGRAGLSGGPQLQLNRKLITMLMLLFLLTIGGTIGLRIIEGAPWLDCLYMIVISLSTVGYEDPVDLSDGGRIFMMTFLICGLGVFTYSAFQLGQWMVSEQLWSLREGRRMEKEIAKLSNHYIVCGQGRMGTEICRYLESHNCPFVVVDQSEERLVQIAGDRNWVYLVGDATDDETLRKAGIERARSLAAVLPTDADNVYVVLSARMMAPEIQIISRATEDRAIEKLERAGATRIVSPFASGAVKMARFMLNPSIEDFIELADRRGHNLELADLQVRAGSPYIGKRLSETDFSARGAMVIGIRRASGATLMPPPPTTLLETGDCLIAFGDVSAINALLEADGFRGTK